MKYGKQLVIKIGLIFMKKNNELKVFDETIHRYLCAELLIWVKRIL